MRNCLSQYTQWKSSLCAAFSCALRSLWSKKIIEHCSHLTVLSIWLCTTLCERKEEKRERREEKNLVLVQILLRGARPPADPTFPQIHSRCPAIFLLRLLLLIVSMFTLFCPLSCLPPKFFFLLLDLAKEIFLG